MFNISLNIANTLYGISNVALGFGALLVLLGTLGSIWSGGIRERFSDERIARDESQTATANERAAVAELQAAQARLELQNFKAPRTLNQVQLARVAEKLKPFAGTVYDAGIGPKGDPEPLYILRSIHAALSSAAWDQIPWTGGGDTYTELGMETVGLTMVTNVIIDVHPGKWHKFGPAAVALAEALAAEGIDAIADSTPTSMDSDAIHVRIGRKL